MDQTKIKTDFCFTKSLQANTRKYEFSVFRSVYGQLFNAKESIENVYNNYCYKGQY